MTINMENTERTKRLAVVVGNSDYQNLANVANATNDANAVQQMLTSLEFEVTCGINLSRDEILGHFNNILDSWEHKAKDIVFYYSGRAMSSDDKVYLAPYHTDIDSPSALAESFLDVDIIINTLLKKRKNHKVPIIVILNCYHSLLKSGGIHSDYQGYQLQHVNKEFDKNANIVILYSMTEDELASNGGIENDLSPYTRILLENVERDWTFNELHNENFKSLKNSGKLGGRQEPLMYQNLSIPYRFCLPRTLKVIPHNIVKDPCHGVPQENQNFINRSKIFVKIEAAFAEISFPSRCRILALQGLGGTGKTQIILRYFYDHRLEYDFIFWLEIDGRAAALESFRKLAINLGLGADNAKEKSTNSSIIQWVSTWLEKKKEIKWLLLLNNADEEMTKYIFDVLPRFGGDIIMTTRDPVPCTKAKTIHVSKMEEEEALALLHSPNPINQKILQSTQYQYAKEIVSELDALPLAIDLARAYTETGIMDFKEYLTIFRSESECAEVFSHRDKDNIHQYNHSLATVWKMSFDRASPVAALILDVCSFFQPELIPISFFEQQYYILSRGLDFSISSEDPSRIVSEAISNLVGLFLVTLSTQDNGPARKTLSIHKLVQKVNFSRMNYERKIQLVKNVFEALNNQTEILNPYSPLSRFIMNTYHPHIHHFATLLKNSNQDLLLSIKLEDLLVQTVCYLLDNGIYIDVEALAILAVSVSESKYGADNLSTTRALYSLAYFYHANSMYDSAEPLYQRIAQITEKALGPMDINTAISLNNLASLYDNQGKHTDAQLLYERALRIAEKILPPDDPNTASYLNNMALISASQCKLLHVRALVIRTKTLGPAHPDTASSLNDLASLYAYHGEYTEAELLYKRALEIREKELPQHVYTASSLNSLGRLYVNQNKYADAELLFKQALAIMEKTEHRDTASYLNDLAKLYLDQNKYADAEPLFEQAQAVMENIFGPEHPDTASHLNDLGKLYMNQGKYADAEPLFERAKVIMENVFGHEHPDTVSYLNDQALFKQALAIIEKTEY